MANPQEHLSSRDWPNLPDLALAIILRFLLPSHRDLISFSLVCRSFHHVLSSISLSLLPSLPPLLLNPNSSLLTLPSNPPLPFNPSTLSPSLLASHQCLAYSHGHLLLLPRFTSPHLALKPIIASITTASQIVLPSLPDDHLRVPYYYATLTAPPSSPSCLLLLFFSQSSFLSCVLSHPDATWTVHKCSVDVSYVARVVTFGDRIFGINNSAKLLQFNFGDLNGPNPSVRLLNILGLHHRAKDLDMWHFGPQLVCTADQILLILILLKPKLSIQIYRLDWKKKEWIQVRKLRDSAIFIDCGGKTPVSCEKPEKWGGKSNCVYLAGPGCESWTCFSLAEKAVLPMPPLRGAFGASMARWPSPIWVHPSVFFR